MATPELDYYVDAWIDIQPGAVQLRLLAHPPVAAGVGIDVFTRPTPVADGAPAQWSRTVQAEIDNLPATPSGETFQVAVAAGNEYVIRFQGEAHLLMPGFQDVAVEFVLSSATAVLTNYGGAKVAAPARAAGLNGNAWLRCA